MTTDPLNLIQTELPSDMLDDGWRSVQRKRASRAHARARRIRGGAYLAVSVLCLFLLRVVWPHSSEKVPSSPTVAATALHQRDGVALAAVVEASEVPSSIELDDGSSVTLEKRTSLAPTVNDGRVFGVNLARGTATFDVKPGGPRRWEIDAGIARVVVLGTKFSVARREGHVVVTVERGHVRVESDALPLRAKDLYAGDVVDVVPSERVSAPEALPLPTSNPSSVATSAVPSLAKVGTPAAAPGSPSSQMTAGPSVEAAPDWKALARRGDFKGAYAILGGAGFATEVRMAKSGSDLLSLSDIAKSSGHPADARAPLERIVSEFPADAALAAFTRAVLEIDALANPGAAAKWFERAIELGIGSTLRETAMARRVEAFHAVGDAASSQRAGTAYLSAYPTGRYREAVFVWSAR